MEFNDYTLMGPAFRDNAVRSNPGRNIKGKTLQQFYAMAEAMITADEHRSGAAEIATMAEARWFALRRPYYSVWPHVVEGLSRVPLTVDAAKLRLPIDTLCIRFAKSDTPTFADVRLRSVLVQLVEIPPESQPGAATAFWSVAADVGAKALSPYASERGVELPFPATFNIHLVPGTEFEQLLTAIDGIYADLPSRQAALKFAARIVAGCCLLASDPDIVVPDVLAADRQRYDETGDLKYVEKAHRRGKIGWNVGARLEMDPHYRRAHLGLRWCGKGRTEPRIVPISGCLVKRQKLKEVPTGYLDDEVCPTCGSYRVPQTGICAHCQKAEHDKDRVQRPVGVCAAASRADVDEAEGPAVDGGGRTGGRH